MWSKWSVGLTGEESVKFDFFVYILATMILATTSCLLTMTTCTTFPGLLEIKNVDEDISLHTGSVGPSSSSPEIPKSSHAPPVLYYPAAGSGVAEVKVILSGFVLHVCTDRFLQLQT